MKTLDSQAKVYKCGFYVSIATAITTIITFTMAFFTPPLSGPWCEASCFEYPYTNITSRFPRDYFWMYPAMFVMILYTILMVCIHRYVQNENKTFSQLGLSFALMAAMILISNYFVQVSVIQPSLLKGETEGIAILSQYNPHGVFIALEEIGFMLVNISFFSLVPAFPHSTGLHRALRTIWIVAFVLALLALGLISFQYGIMREYFFEIAIISIVWIELILTSILLSKLLKVGLKKTVRAISR